MPAPQGYVNDFVGVFSQDQKLILESQLAQIKRSTSVEVAVVVVDSTEQMPIEMYATSIGNKWGVGAKDVFNGVVILIVINDRAWFIATAKGIEGTLPDITAKRIGENNFPNNFRQGDYYTGVFGAIYDINGYVQNDPTIKSMYLYQQNYQSNNQVSDFADEGALDFLVFLSTFVMIFLLFSSKMIFIKSKPLDAIAPLGLYLIYAIIIISLILSSTVDWFVGGFVLFFVLVFALTIAFGSVSSSSGYSGGGFGGGSFGGGWSSGGGSSFGGGGGFSGGGAGGRW